MADKKAVVQVDGKSFELPIYSGSAGTDVIDVRALGQHGYFTFDPGFMSTGSCESKITYIDGDNGVLLHRGYPIEQLADRGLAPELKFLRFVASKVDENKSMQKELLQLMRTLFGHAMVRTPLKDSAEIDNATARLMTVYELDGPATSSAVRNRCLNYLDGVNSEIEVDIRSMWPSHQKRLRQEALV